jgi:hypothetical protein
VLAREIVLAHLTAVLGGRVAEHAFEPVEALVVEIAGPARTRLIEDLDSALLHPDEHRDWFGEMVELRLAGATTLIDHPHAGRAEVPTEVLRAILKDAEAHSV